MEVNKSLIKPRWQKTLQANKKLFFLETKILMTPYPSVKSRLYSSVSFNKEQSNE